MSTKDEQRHRFARGETVYAKGYPHTPGEIIDILYGDDGITYKVRWKKSGIEKNYGRKNLLTVEENERTDHYAADIVRSLRNHAAVHRDGNNLGTLGIIIDSAADWIERAAKQLQSDQAIHQVMWHGNKHWTDVPREEYIALKALHNEDMQSRIVHLNALDRPEVIEEAYQVCMELSQKYDLEGCDALQSAAGILRTRLKRGSLAVALDFIKKLPDYEPEVVTEDPPAVEPEESGLLPIGTRISKRGFDNTFGFVSKREPGDSYEVRWYLTGRISTEARKNLVVAPYPVSLNEQCEEHLGTDFEIFTFSDGKGRILRRNEFDIQFGHGLRIYLERARDNRIANEDRPECPWCANTGYNQRGDNCTECAKDAEPQDGAIERAVQAIKNLSELDEAVKVFEAAACKQTYKLRDGVAAVLEHARNGDEIPVEIWHGNRKVSIYSDRVLRVWGANIETEMNDEPRTLQSVQSAVDWVYGREMRELVNRFLMWRLPEKLRVDKCAWDGTYPQLRSGTNLLNSIEAEQMLQHVLNVPHAAERDWITNLRKELMLSKMTHQFTFSRDEVMELLGGPLAAIHVARASAEDMLRDQLEEVGRTARQAQHARDVYRAVLEGMEFLELDELPTKGIGFAREVGEKAFLKTVKMVKTLERIEALKKNPGKPYTDRLSEGQNENLDYRIFSIAQKYAQRSLNTMVWSIENHKLFILMREFLNEEIRRKEALESQRVDGPLDRSKITLPPTDPATLTEARKKEIHDRFNIED